MEVHTHSHSPRKKWTHYFWEFLMLFLAVFCGFLAENKREHLVEKHRARDYAKSLYTDLKSDTADILKGINYLNFFTAVMDSVYSIGSRLIGKTQVPGIFYYYNRLTTNTYPVDWSRSTLYQLIQSGNLRYFSNKELVDKINSYYALQGKIDGANGVDETQRETIRTMRNKMFDHRYMASFFRKMTVDDAVNAKPLDPKLDSLMHTTLPLQPGSDKYLNEYFNHLHERELRLRMQTAVYFTRALGLAEDIMKSLKAEYRVE